MADALCGPSNALQNFQKHSTVDRTLQQDRLTSRHSPSQGFRSSPGPSAGLLDLEFEAFQAGQIPLPHPEAEQFHPAGFPSSYVPQSLNQPASTAWASDFQHLNISSPPPQFQQRNYAQQAQPQQLGTGWQNEFAKQHSQSAGPANSNYTGYSSSPFQRLSTIAPMAPLQAQTYPIAASEGQLGQPQTQGAEAFDEEAFARAFDQAAQSELAMEQAAQRLSLGADQDVLLKESAERLMGAEQVLEPQRLGADLIHDSREGEGEQQQNQQDDPDALARTAGQLLDSVRDNQSDKFQKSQFLQLMRQLRDREVTVEGDKIVGVQSESEGSKGKDALEKSLLSIARQLSLLDFARVEPLLHPTSTSTPSPYRSVPDQLTLGAFTRTLMQASAALDALATKYPPGLLERVQPFGMSIGVEVFALAAHPLLMVVDEDHENHDGDEESGSERGNRDAYPALRALVLSFRAQFEELGIDERMVRRWRREGVYEGSGVREGESGRGDGVESRGEGEGEGGGEWNEKGEERGGEGKERDEQEQGEAESHLHTWLTNWLSTTTTRRRRQIYNPSNSHSNSHPLYSDDDDGTSSATAEWLFSPQQLHDLLGPHIYPLSTLSSSASASFPQQQQQPQEQAQRILHKHLRAILGPHLLYALHQIWTSAHTRIFINPVVADVEGFEGFVEGLVGLLPKRMTTAAGGGDEMGKDGGEMGNGGEVEIGKGVELRLEDIFPQSREGEQRRAWREARRRGR